MISSAMPIDIVAEIGGAGEIGAATGWIVAVRPAVVVKMLPIIGGVVTTIGSPISIESEIVGSAASPNSSVPILSSAANVAIGSSGVTIHASSSAKLRAGFAGAEFAGASIDREEFGDSVA